MARTKKNNPPPVRKGSRPRALTDKQRIFVAEYLVSLNATDAARKAGYDVRSAPGHIRQLTDPKKYPHIAYQIKQAMAKREQLLEYKADDLLQQIQTVAFLDCTFWFEPGDDDYWYIQEEDYRVLPIQIKRCIKAAKYLTEFVTDEEGVLKSQPTGVVAVQVMDKEHMMALCAKYMLTESKRLDGTIHQVNWDMLIEAGRNPQQMMNQPQQTGNQAIADKSVAIEDKKVDSSSNQADTGESSADQTIETQIPKIVPQDHVEEMIEMARRVEGDSSIKRHINKLQSDVPSFDGPVEESAE